MPSIKNWNTNLEVLFSNEKHYLSLMSMKPEDNKKDFILGDCNKMQMHNIFSWLIEEKNCANVFGVTLPRLIKPNHFDFRSVVAHALILSFMLWMQSSLFQQFRYLAVDMYSLAQDAIVTDIGGNEIIDVFILPAFKEIHLIKINKLGWTFFTKTAIFSQWNNILLCFERDDNIKWWLFIDETGQALTILFLYY